MKQELMLVIYQKKKGLEDVRQACVFRRKLLVACGYKDCANFLDIDVATLADYDLGRYVVTYEIKNIKGG